MNKKSIITEIFLICVLPSTSLKAKTNTNADLPTFSVTSFDYNYKTLRLSYEIRNNSNKDIWICDSIAQNCNFEAFLSEDVQTLVIRKRLDVPSSAIWAIRPTGKYIRIGPGKQRTESLLLSMPVYLVHVYSSRKYSQSFTKATQLSIEIGYYIGNLPQMYLDKLQGHENPTDDRSKIQNIHLGAASGFNRIQESLRQRNDEVRIQYTYQEFISEKVLEITIGDLSIPCTETSTKPKYTPPDLTNCNRLEIHYEPSILEYYYPYENEQALLSKEEVDFLQSRKKIVMENTNIFSDFAKELREIKTNVGGIISGTSKANINGYHDNRQIASFMIYDDTTIDTEQEMRINYFSTLQSFRMLVQQIKPYELRRQCAANLKILWYRLRLYDQTDKRRQLSIDLDTVFGDEQTKYEYTKIDFIYPAPRSWCDDMELAYTGFYTSNVQVCPGVSEARSTYAMNPNCKYDSPSDTVLLFETKAGRNQHGGPELFTFDNHDPKGGCVLLNDGTVKFIRTKEELQLLRWK